MAKKRKQTVVEQLVAAIEVAIPDLVAYSGMYGGSYLRSLRLLDAAVKRAKREASDLLAALEELLKSIPSMADCLGDGESCVHIESQSHARAAIAKAKEAK